MLSSTLKTNFNLEKTVVTGCLKIAKESIFTDLNAFKSYSLTDPKYTSLFGFTEKEVKIILEEFNLSDKFEIIKQWCYSSFNLS